MIHMLRFSVLVFLGALAGCASPKIYFADRGRDALDVVTFTLGEGAGAQFRVGPIHAGLSAYHDVFGVRGGRWVIYPTDGHGALESISGECTIVCYEYFDPNAFAEDGVERYKSYEARGIPFIAFVDPPYSGKDESNRPLLHSYYTHVDLCVSVVGGLRIGINPGEIMDFILGWTTFDFYKDDVELKVQEEEKLWKKWETQNKHVSGNSHNPSS